MCFVECSIVVMLGMFVATQARCVTSSNNCTAVQSIPVPLSKFAKNSPYYLLATSSSTNMGINVSSIDSVCYTLYSTCNPEVYNILGITTLKNNGSCEVANGTLSETSAKTYYFYSSQATLEDFVLGQLCHSIYVLYLCSLTGSFGDSVVILSTERSVDAHCLQEAECLAANSFPGITFTKLPNTAPYPCIGCSDGNYNCTCSC